MSILLCVSIAWATVGILFMGLDLIVLRVAERASGSSRAMIADDRIAHRAPRMASDDLAISERQPADNISGLAQLESMIISALHDANAKARCAAADRKEHTGAVIVRDPRLTRARCAADKVRQTSPSLC